MKFYTRYSPPKSPSSDTVGKSRTRQEFAAECDINNIVSRVGAGVLGPLHAPEPVYVDLDSVPQTYEESFALIQDAQARFGALPSRVRDYFHNRPENLLAFLSDESNRDKAIDLGLIPAPAVVEPAPAVKETPNA